MTAITSVPDLVNLDRYPIDSLDSELGAALVERGRQALASTDGCPLPGFLSPAGLETLAAESRLLAPLAHVGTSQRNVFFSDDDPTLAPDHPQRIFLDRRLALVGYHLIPPDAWLTRLYLWPPLRRLLAALLGQEKLYCFDDPYQAVNLSVMDESSALNWHFDSNEYTVTLSLVEAEAGGEFEYAHQIRTPEDDNPEAIKRVLAGDRTAIERVPMPAGALMLFKGRYSLHRVTPIRGGRRRLMAVILYESHPGRRSSYAVNRQVYGPSVGRGEDGSFRDLG